MVEKMIVVDISPLGYTGENQSEEALEHLHIISSLQKLDIPSLKTREEADRKLSENLPSPMVRQFLLKSLKRKASGTYEWMLNMDALEKNMNAIFDGIVHETVTDPRSIPSFPLMFIKGERSGYIRQRDLEAIDHYFPQASVVTIPGSGHWVHAEQPEEFLRVLQSFISGIGDR
jgi:pimeloyl-ACP methyl ester carboxylesterase